MSKIALWGGWFVLTAVATGWLIASLPSERSAHSAAGIFLPGETTHGHYQIEMKCGACHEPTGGFREQSCADCHAAELQEARDTHPRSKFTDPSKAHLLAHVQADRCVTCHREHVPERTHAMGVTLPADYCFHCHQSIAQDRPSHAGFQYDSCATAGCHNFHDNRALYEKFLLKHDGEPEILKTPRVPLREMQKIAASTELAEVYALLISDADARREAQNNKTILADWAESAHARAGVNCSGCHSSADEANGAAWSDDVTHQACQQCHQQEVDGFLASRHGMRLAQSLPPMTPGMARLPMRSDSLHRSLTCNACHPAHGYDTRRAAVDSCLSCHDDDHSRAYTSSMHYELWKRELAGDAAPGSGVSCATCHMPRQYDGKTHVVHNQNWNLRPNEKMIRSVCADCHGLAFSLDALADPALKQTCYQGQPAGHLESLDMARAWFETKHTSRRPGTAE